MRTYQVVRSKIALILQITMSQADPADSDTSPPPSQPLHTEPDSFSEDILSAPLPPPLIPEGAHHPAPTEETIGDNAAKGDGSQFAVDQPERGAEGEVAECDQAVSLEPDTAAAEEEMEVKLSVSCF